MKTKIIVSFLLLIVIIMYSGCSDKAKKYNYTNYKKLERPNKTINLKSTKINDFELLVPTAIGLIENYLIIVDKKADKVIKIIDLKSKNLVTAFGKRGQGPSEFVGASDIIQDPIKTNMFWVFDISARKLKKFDINKVVKNIFEPEKIILFKEGVGIPKQVIITENKIIGIGFFFKGRIAIYDLNGNYIKSLGKIPVNFKNERFASQHSLGFEGKFVYKKKTKTIFIAPLLSDIIEKYDENGVLCSTLHGPDLFFPEYEIVQAGEYYTITYNKKTRNGYVDICYNKKFDNLFLLYSGKYFFDTNRNLFYNTVYVIGKDDKIIEKIKLDTGVKRIKMSNDGKIIYALSGNKILKFTYKK